MRPNVLWIFCEDLSPWLPAYGDHTVATPHIDRLAAEGTLFTRCFSPSPVCSPARSSLITGGWSTRIGAHQHVSSRPGMPAIPLPAPVRPLPVLVREQGYFTYNLGKDDYNFDYRRDDLYHGPHAHVQFYGEHHDGCGALRGPEVDFAYWRQRPAHQPFFGQITLWAGKNHVRVAPEVDRSAVGVMPYYPDTAIFREMIARHYDQIATTDAEVGRIMSQLAEDRLLENTWVFFFSDHGYELPRHKQFCYDGGTHVPLIVRPPDAHRDNADRYNPWRGRVCDDLVSSLDITASTLDVVGGAIPSWYDSVSLFDATRQRRFVVSTRDRCDGTLDRIRTIRTESFRYIRNFHPERAMMQPQYRSDWPSFQELHRLAGEGQLPPAARAFTADTRPAEELYRVATDPHEVTNLATDPHYADALAEHRAILDQWVHDTADRGDEPEPPAQYEWLVRQWGPEMCWQDEYLPARRAIGALQSSPNP